MARFWMTVAILLVCSACGFSSVAQPIEKERSMPQTKAEQFRFEPYHDKPQEMLAAMKEAFPVGSSFQDLDKAMRKLGAYCGFPQENNRTQDQWEIAECEYRQGTTLGNPIWYPTVRIDQNRKIVEWLRVRQGHIFL